VTKDGRVERLYAGQVAVCAGALNSPALLLRSGIGPPQSLAAAGIPLHIDLPGVGRGLRDHPTLLLGLGQERGHGASSALWFQVMLRHLKGTIPGLPDCALEIYHDFLLAPATAAYRRSRLAVSLLAARGTGAVTLTSAEPGDSPTILLGYRDPADLRDLARGLAFALDLTEAPAFARLGPRNLKLLAPAGSRPGAPQDFLHRLRREVERCAEALGGYTTTAHHFHGGCAMGPVASREAVVDESFRVHRTENLRVGDASVIPIPFRANTHLAAILIGERLGRRIAADGGPS
jgi:choline dehydrogenase